MLKRETLDKIESIVTFILMAAAAAFNFTADQTTEGSALIAQSGTWVFTGYLLFKGIVEWVKSLNKKKDANPEV